MTAIERQRAEYGLRTLEKLHEELRGQLFKYPNLKWIEREIRREKKLLVDPQHQSP